MMKQADAKYYHAFNNGACYEFALGIATDDDGNVEEITPVDRQAVFARLEKILATVKLQPCCDAGNPDPGSRLGSRSPRRPSLQRRRSEHQARARQNSLAGRLNLATRVDLDCRHSTAVQVFDFPAADNRS